MAFWGLGGFGESLVWVVLGGVWKLGEWDVGV